MRADTEGVRRRLPEYAAVALAALAAGFFLGWFGAGLLSRQQAEPPSQADAKPHPRALQP